MKIITLVERLEPNTVYGEAVKISHTYTSFDKDRIDKLYKEMVRLDKTISEVLEGEENNVDS